MPPRTRFAAILGLALFCLAAPARAKSEWQVVKVGRWDYLSVENIARFYGFAGDTTPVEKTIRIDNGQNQLEVTLGSREAIVNGVRNWLCFPVIEGAGGSYLVSRIDLAKTIEPQFRPHMIRNLRALKTVVIDAGHGGVEKGAGSSYGNEKTFTLDVAKRLKARLEAKGLKVVMTRSGDDLVPLPLRARIANATKDSVFVSLHFNATDQNPTATGFEIYSLTPRGAPSTQDNSLKARFANMQAGSPADAASLVLSTSVYHAMLGHMPEFDRGVKRARFAVLRLTQIPAILVEGGFLTERQESRLIAQAEWREKLAEAISVGIDNFKTLVETKQRPMLLADYRRQFEGVLVARDGNAPPAADTAPAVIPASNSQAGLSAQLTSPVHREPSPQIAMGESSTGDSESDEEDEHSTASAEPGLELHPAPADIPPLTPEAGPVVAENIPAPIDPPAAETNTTALPPPGPPVVVLQPEPTAPPAPRVVRKYWVLKFDPPPKFRQ